MKRINLVSLALLIVFGMQSNRVSADELLLTTGVCAFNINDLAKRMEGNNFVFDTDRGEISVPGSNASRCIAHKIDNLLVIHEDCAGGQTATINNRVPAGRTSACAFRAAEYHSSCDRNGRMTTGGCVTAAARFCRWRGHGNFGIPVDDSGPNREYGVACYRHSGIVARGGIGNCAGQRYSAACLRVAHSVCREDGYLGGIAIEIGPNETGYGCIRRQDAQFFVVPAAEIAISTGVNCVASSGQVSTACIVASGRRYCIEKLGFGAMGLPQITSHDLPDGHVAIVCAAGGRHSMKVAH